MQLTKGAIGNLINRYKAVLKKCHLMNTFGSLAVAGMLIMGGAGVAVAADDVALKGKNNYNSTNNPEVNHLMGGWLVNNAETAKEAHGDITLTVKGGTISEIIGGSYPKGLAASGDSLLITHGNITTTISGDTTSAEFVVGGSVAHNYSGTGTIKVSDNGNTSVTITGGTFNPSQSSLTDERGGINLSAAVIGGGLAYGANTNSVLGSKEAPVTSRVSINGARSSLGLTVTTPKSWPAASSLIKVAPLLSMAIPRWPWLVVRLMTTSSVAAWWRMRLHCPRTAPPATTSISRVILP